jgi:hypothetical protein
MPPATYCRRSLRVFLSIALLVCAATLPCHVVMAQDTEAISTERPTVGPSPDVIAPRSLQVETGLGVSFQRSRYAADLPESLIRFGVTKRFEVRFQAGNVYYQPSQAPGIKLFQTADTDVSAKVLLGSPNLFAPRAAIVNLSLPTGGLQYTSGSHDPSLTLVWTQNITHSWSVNEVAQGTLTTLDGARRSTWEPSVAVSHPLSDILSGYAEYAPSLLQDRSLVYVLDGGLELVRNKTHQLDVHAGYQADSGGIHTLIGFGYSSGRRIPPLVMGHEAAGTIAAVGSQVSGFTVGDRVTFDSTVYCGACAFCRKEEINLCDNRQVVGVSCGDYSLKSASFRARHQPYVRSVLCPTSII